MDHRGQQRGRVIRALWGLELPKPPALSIKGDHAYALRSGRRLLRLLYEIVAVDAFVALAALTTENRGIAWLVLPARGTL